MEKLSFKNKYGEKLVGDLSKNNDSNIMVIVCHGFTGHRNKNFLPELFEAISSKKYNVFKHDFAGNGESEGEIGKASYFKEIDDLITVLDVLESKGYKKFCLIGHSMGGSVSILTTTQDKRVKWLIDIAAPAYPEKGVKKRYFTPERVKEAYEKGSAFSCHPRKKFKFYKIFFEDLEKVNVPESMKKVKVPLLIIHGAKDASVPLKESKDLFILANNPKNLEIISGAGHLFAEDNKANELIQAIINWLTKWVKK